jgi:hypothetical protein
MHAREIIRVFCVDGPCHGLHYIEIKTGRVLDEDPDDLGLWYIYQVSDHEITRTNFGPSPSAHFSYVKPADKPADKPAKQPSLHAEGPLANHDQVAEGQ